MKMSEKSIFSEFWNNLCSFANFLPQHEFFSECQNKELCLTLFFDVLFFPVFIIFFKWMFKLYKKIHLFRYFICACFVAFILLLFALVRQLNWTYLYFTFSHPLYSLALSEKYGYTKQRAVDVTITVCILSVIITLILIISEFKNTYNTHAFSNHGNDVKDLDLTAKFDTPGPDDASRVFTIGNITPGTSVLKLKQFLLSDLHMYKRYKDDLDVEVFTTKPGPGDSWMATATIPYPCYLTTRHVVSCLMQQKNKEFEGRKIRIKEVRNHKEKTIKSSKWTSEDDGVFMTKDKKENISRILTPTHYPKKMYTSIDAAAMVINNNDNDVIERALACGVEKIIMRCDSLKSSHIACKVANQFPDILYFTAGVCFDGEGVQQWKDDSLEALTKLANDPQCVAIGKCGLSATFHKDDEETKKKKINVFKSQVELAYTVKKPLSLEVMQGDGKSVLDILEQYQPKLPKIILTSTGYQDISKEILLKFVQMGFYFGISGETFAKHFIFHKAKMIRQGIIPVSRLIVESNINNVPTFTLKTRQALSEAKASGNTYLTQQSVKYCNSKFESYREPCEIPVHIEIISDNIKCPPKQTAEILLQNARDLFQLRE